MLIIKFAVNTHMPTHTPNVQICYVKAVSETWYFFL